MNDKYYFTIAIASSFINAILTAEDTVPNEMGK
jgi:hypothetical protein